MKKKLLVLVAVVALVAAATMPAFAADPLEETVSCTVTAKVVALTVTDGTVAYGVLDLGATNDTISEVDMQVIENTGNG